MKTDKRVAPRKETEFIEIHDLTLMMDYSVLARYGKIVNASSSGFLLLIDRSDIIPEDLRNNLTLASTLGQSVVLYLPQMNLDLDGSICRARHLGKGNYELAIEFSAEVPEYWRECLIELLPTPGEIAS